MELRFIVPDLDKLDEVKCEALAIPFFVEDRPLKGALGMVDWRMCGLISRMIVRGRVSAEKGEVLLVPGRPRLSMDKLFLFGMGSVETFDETLAEETIGRMLQTLTLAQVRTSALELPGRTTGQLEPARAIELFLRVAAEHLEHDEVVLVETLEGQKAMDPVLQRERRRARAFVA